jgi:hypothetical protein
MVADAVAVDRAWTVATRGRVMPVAVAPVGVPGVPGAGGKWLGRLGKFGAGLAASSALRNPAIATTVAILATPGASGAKEGDRRAQKAALFNGEWGEEYPYLTNAAFFVTHGSATPAQVKLIKSLGEPPWSEGQLAAAERQAKRLAGGGGSGPHRTTAPPTRGTKGGGRKTRGGAVFTFGEFEKQQAAIQERAIDAVPSASTVDDVREARAELALIRRALAELKLTAAQRVELKQRRNALLADIARVDQENEQAAQAIRDKRAATAKAARDKREAREKAEQEAEAKHMERVMKRAQDHYERMAKLTKGIDFTTRAGLRKAALRGIDPKTGKPKGAKDDADKPLTEADIRRMQFEFITGLHGVLNQFGGNVGDSPGDFGMAGTHAQLQTLELREQTKILRDFTGTMRHPMTAYHRAEGTTLLVGTGF